MTYFQFSKALLLLVRIFNTTLSNRFIIEKGTYLEGVFVWIIERLSRYEGRVQHGFFLVPKYHLSSRCGLPSGPMMARLGLKVYKPALPVTHLSTCQPNPPWSMFVRFRVAEMRRDDIRPTASTARPRQGASPMARGGRPGSMESRAKLSHSYTALHHLVNHPTWTHPSNPPKPSAGFVDVVQPLPARGGSWWISNSI